MKKIILLLLTLLIPFTIKVSANTASIIEGSKSGILIEEETGQILFEKNIDLKLPPASMTKIMSMIIFYEELEKDTIKKEDIVTVSSYAESMGGSQVFLKEGEKITVDDLLKSISIYSANDATVALAEYISGTKEEFVKRMNNKAKELGAKNTNFVNPTGLTDKNHYSSARDMAIFSRYLIKEFNEKPLEYSKVYEDYIRKDTDNPFWLVNRNKVIKIDDKVDGLKTGYTEEAGYCISLTKKDNNLRYIAVTFGYENTADRNSETLNLLNYGFTNFKKELIYEKGTVLEKQFNILNKNPYYNIILNENIYFINKKQQEMPKFDFTYSYNINNNKLKGEFKLIHNQKIISKNELDTIKPLRKANIIDILISVVNLYK